MCCIVGRWTHWWIQLLNVCTHTSVVCSNRDISATSAMHDVTNVFDTYLVPDQEREWLYEQVTSDGSTINLWYSWQASSCMCTSRAPHSCIPAHQYAHESSPLHYLHYLPLQGCMTFNNSSASTVNSNFKSSTLIDYIRLLHNAASVTNASGANRRFLLGCLRLTRMLKSFPVTSAALENTLLNFPLPTRKWRSLRLPQLVHIFDQAVFGD